MNCEQYQRRLLETLDPEDPPDELATHLAACPACRACQRQLIRIERHVPLLPIPASEGKTRFLFRLLNEPGPESAPPPPLHQRHLPWRRLFLGLGGVAAAVALLVGGIVLVGLVIRSPDGNREAPHAGVTPEKPTPSRNTPTLAPVPESAATLVVRLMECDLVLAQANTPRQRVQTLADLADALRDEARTLGQAAAPEALETVAQMYGKVVREGIVQRAHALPSAERGEVLNPIAARLAQVEHDVEEVARNAGPTTAERLRRVALVAREGDAQLRALVRGVAP